MIPRLSWRNIWRNRRRTYITSASVMFAVLLATMLESLQEGAWDHMIDNVVNYYYSYAQIHQKGYWEDQSIDRAFPFDANLSTKITESRFVHEIVPRIESFALAASENRTTGALVIGTDPVRENIITALGGRITSGGYFQDDDHAVLIAEGLAEKLELVVDDTLVLISQGYHGVNAAGKYRIGGILRFGSPELNKQMIYMPLASAQTFYGAEGLITSVAMKINDIDHVPRAIKAIESQIDTSFYEIKDWKQMIPDLVEAKALDNAGNYIVYFILYLVIAFGIFGTVLMMMKEREYEFGVLISIGMNRLSLTSMVCIEILLIALLGTIAGIVISLPVVGYFYVNPIRFGGTYADLLEKFGFEPIFPASFEAHVFFIQALAVFIIVTLVTIHPYLKIRKLRPVEAMRP